MSNLFIILFFSWVQAFAEVTPDNKKRDSRYDDLTLFTKVLTLVEKNHFEEADLKKLIQGAIRGLLQELDPYSSYLPPDKFQDFRQETQGEFAGIGVEISIRDGMLTIVTPIEDTPAMKAGLKPLDRITAINGEPTRNLTLHEASQKLRGRRGEKITLTIQRGGEKPFDVTLIRSSIKIRSVSFSEIESGILHLRISRFLETTQNDLEKWLQNHLRQKKSIKGIILDLRGNPGGLLDQAIKIADMFLPANSLIVKTVSRDAKQSSESFSSDRFKYLDFPILILIDQGSASASEVLTGALQDHKRAFVVGEKSFGKGSIQSIIRLDDGGALKLTVARYYTPSGRVIEGQGILPDVIVSSFFQNHVSKSVGEQSSGAEKDSFLKLGLDLMKILLYGSAWEKLTPVSTE